MRETSTTPSILSSTITLQIASATWSTWIGGIVNAFATESSGDVGAPKSVVDELSDRRTLDGVGSPVGTLRCIVDDKSKMVANGVVNGR
jgi:hypothetical protein